MLRIGKAPFSVGPGKTATVTVRVSGRNARTLRRLGSVRVGLTGVAPDKAGNEGTVERTARLVIARTRR